MANLHYICRPNLLKVSLSSFDSNLTLKQGRIQEGVGSYGGLAPPLGPVKSIDFKMFSGPKQVLSPPLKDKKLSPPGHIPEYAPALKLSGLDHITVWNFLPVEYFIFITLIYKVHPSL